MQDRAARRLRSLAEQLQFRPWSSVIVKQRLSDIVSIRSRQAIPPFVIAPHSLMALKKTTQVEHNRSALRSRAAADAACSEDCQALLLTVAKEMQEVFVVKERGCPLRQPPASYQEERDGSQIPSRESRRATRTSIQFSTSSSNHATRFWPSFNRFGNSPAASVPMGH